MLFVSIIFAGSLIVGQERTQPSKPPSPQPSPSVAPRANTSIYSTEPFDLAVERLPPQFHGHDVEAIYNTLWARKKSATKGEFETTEEFRLRVQKEQAAPIVRNLTINSILAFESRDLDAVYDADRQVLQVAAKLGYVVEGVRPDDKDGRDVWLHDQARLMLAGRRALNSRFRGSVLENNVENFEIAPVNCGDFETTKYIDKSDRDRGRTDDFLAHDALIAALNMDVPTAKRAKENIQLLVVCKLASPFTSYGALDKSMTLYYLNVELLELWVYDISTGQVYVKFRPRR